MVGSAHGAWPAKGTSLHHTPEGRAAASKKGAFEQLQQAIFAWAKRRHWFSVTNASIDSTGLESRHISAYFLKRRKRRCKQTTPFIKVSILCHHESHLIAAAVVRRGPCNDAADFPAAVAQAARVFAANTLMGDAAYDSEAFHRTARSVLGARRTIFPINLRGRKGVAHTRYRRSMQLHFPKRRFGQRWQVESCFSQLKRLLTSHLRAHSEVARFNETYLRILTHNLLILHGHLCFLQSKLWLET